MINKEIENICKNIKIFSDLLKGSKILITGGTGFIGSYLIKSLAKLNDLYDLSIEITGTTTDVTKVNNLSFDKNINWLMLDLNSFYKIDDHYDYIIHAASPTDSNYFVEKPVEVITENITGFHFLLDKLKTSKKLKSFVFLSSLEIYGVCNTDLFLSENQYYGIDCSNTRSSYPESKKILECLCSGYYSEYGSPTKVVRLGQCFGPGISKNDNRVFAQFARAVSSRENIILATKGETKRSYCSIQDAIYGILTVLFNGKNGEAYNLASDNSYVSIHELAEMFVKDTKSKIIINEKKNDKYLNTIKFGLNTDKIKSIGFKSFENINKMVKKLKLHFIEEYNGDN